MKKTIVWLLVVSSLAALLAGCASGKVKTVPGAAQSAAAVPAKAKISNLAAAVRTEKPQAGELTAKDAAAAASFGVKLLQQSEKDGTRLYSPVSILYALGMTLNGANGETKTQMEKTLGLTADELNRAMLAYRSSLPADGAAKIANSIWIRDTENLKVSGDFLKTDSAYYNAEIYRAAFDSSTLDAINAWVSEHTDKMIPTILQELPESAMLCLVNAVAFNAKWAEPYEETDVSDADFTKADGTKETVKMMYSAENVYLDDGQATGFLKRYEGGDYAFAALMPNEGVSMDDYVASLTGESLMNTLENAQSCGVDAGLPKFTRDYSAELSQTLAALGMPDAFDPAKADFSNMGESAEGTLAISQVIHKTHIELDEQGTKAAAATAVMATTTCVALEAETKRVILNRPFVYMILDTRTNLPVFLGLMADPANS